MITSASKQGNHLGLTSLSFLKQYLYVSKDTVRQRGPVIKRQFIEFMI